jgi:hypothetical protein
MTKEIHTPDTQKRKAMSSALDALPENLSSLDIAAFISGVLDAYHIKGLERSMLLLQVVQSSISAESEATTTH